MTAFTAKSTAEQVAKHFSNAINSKSGTITFNWPLPQLALTIATVLVTGVTQGTLGAEVALRISHHQPANLVLAGRSLSALNITKSTIEAANPVSVTLLELDLASQASVRAAARTANSYPFTIDVLINNAGIMAVPYTKTAEGLERQWATNHIGHFLFTNLIMPKLRASRSTARIVNVSSAGHKRSDIRWDDVGFGGGERYDKWAAYGQTKTANMLFSVALAKLGGVESFSCYPGRVRTNLVNSIPLEELVAAGGLPMFDNAGKQVLIMLMLTRVAPS